MFKTAFPTQTRHALPIVAALLLLTSACLKDLNFDDIEPECAAPRFDSPNRDAYCSGNVTSEDARALPEHTQILGLDSTTDMTLAVSTGQLFVVDGVPIVQEIGVHFADPRALSTQDEIHENQFVSMFLQGEAQRETPKAVSLLSPEIEYPLAGILNSSELVLASPASAPDFHIIQLFLRVMPTRLTGVYDMDSVDYGDEVMIFVAMGAAGIKPIVLEWGEGQWNETIFSAADVNRATALSFYTPSTCHVCLASEQEDNEELQEACQNTCAPCRRGNSGECSTCMVDKSLAYPMGEGAFSVHTNPEMGLTFVGSLSEIVVYYTDELHPGNLENLSHPSLTPGIGCPENEILSYTEPRASTYSLPIPEDEEEGRYVAYATTSITSTEGKVAAIIQDLSLFDPVDGDPAESWLLVGSITGDARLENNFQRIKLPAIFKTSVLHEMTFLENGLLAIQVVDSQYTYLRGDDGDEALLPTAGDLHLYLYDTVQNNQLRDPVYHEVIDSRSSPGVKGMARVENNVLLLTEPNGISVREIDLEGGAYRAPAPPAP